MVRHVFKKKIDIQAVTNKEQTIYENINKGEKKMTSDDINSIKKSLQQHFFFHHLSEQNLEVVLSKMFYATQTEGNYIFKQGDPGNCLFIIDVGRVEVEIDG